MTLNKQLSILTSIDENVFNNLLSKAEWCICDSVEQSCLDNKQKTSIDIGIGTLLIKHNSDKIEYKFIPSEEFEKDISDCVINNKNGLTKKKEKSLINRLTNVYKDLL